MIDPQTQELLKELKEKNLLADVNDTPVEARKRLYDRLYMIASDKQEVSSVKDMEIDGKHGNFKVRVYRPAGSKPEDVLPVLIYYHGGGWVIGSIDTVDSVCRQISNESGACVISVDYHLAPEWKFPAAVDDAFTAAYWVYNNSKALNIDGGKIAVGGDSAGGCLSNVVSILARDAGDLPIKFQMLIYPGAKINPTAAGDGDAPVLGNDFLNYYKNHYLENDEQALDWRASPILCPDLTNLPPTFMVTAGNDPLHEDSLELAQKLSEAGNKCTAITFERQVHGFVTLARSIDEAQTAISICAAELRRQLA